jgi:hypothetical protein
MHATVTRYEVTDALQAELLDARRYFTGDSSAPRSTDSLQTPEMRSTRRWSFCSKLPPVAVCSPRARGLSRTRRRRRRWTARCRRAVADGHPGAVDEMVGAMPGVVSGLTDGWLDPRSVPESAGLLARLYADGTPLVTPAGSVPGGNAPTGFYQLLEGLDARDRGSGGAADYDDKDPNGQIDVRVIETVGPDGVARRSYVVDIPSTATGRPRRRSPTTTSTTSAPTFAPWRGSPPPIRRRWPTRCGGRARRRRIP